MPTPRNILATMRKTATLEASLALNSDLATIGQHALVRMQHAARTEGSLQALRDAIEAEMARCQAAAAERMRQDREQHDLIMHTVYADEVEPAPGIKEAAENVVIGVASLIMNAEMRREGAIDVGALREVVRPLAAAMPTVLEASLSAALPGGAA